MRTILLVSAGLVLGATAAHAETFTFTGTGTPVAQIAGPGPGGNPVSAGHSTTATEVVWASGTKMKSTGDCMGWSAPPATGFTSQGLCTATDADGAKTFMAFTCLASAQKGEADCWGRLTYTSGKNVGKIATASWHGHQNADGKGSTVAGAGIMP